MMMFLENDQHQAMVVTVARLHHASLLLIHFPQHVVLSVIVLSLMHIKVNGQMLVKKRMCSSGLSSLAASDLSAMDISWKIPQRSLNESVLSFEQKVS